MAVKRTFDYLLLASLVILLPFISGCVSAGLQHRELYTYSSEIYDACRVSPGTEEEVLGFLAQDSTDKNVWVAGVYECGHFAADLWWNAYTEGLEACMVWVKRWEQGQQRVHWVVKFRIQDNTGNYWLWVEPSNDQLVNQEDYVVEDTFCGEEAFNLCQTWWQESLD
ncbi:MAG: hypothetical protein ACUVTR_06310 [Dehalococcoidia bacterium]